MGPVLVPNGERKYIALLVQLYSYMSPAKIVMKWTTAPLVTNESVMSPMVKLNSPEMMGWQNSYLYFKQTFQKSFWGQTVF